MHRHHLQRQQHQTLQRPIWDRMDYDCWVKVIGYLLLVIGYWLFEKNAAALQKLLFTGANP